MECPTITRHTFSIDDLAACAGMTGSALIGLSPYLGDMAGAVFLANILWAGLANPICILHNYRAGTRNYMMMFLFYEFWAVVGVLGGIA